jgi:hypothetical protein
VKGVPDRLDRLGIARGEECLSHADIIPDFGANARVGANLSAFLSPYAPRV